MKYCLLGLFMIAGLAYGQETKWDFTKKEAEKLGSNINSKYHEILPVATNDLMYFSRRNHPSNAGGTSDNVEIWYARKNGNDWGEAKHMVSKLNNVGFNFISDTYGEWTKVLLGGRYEKGYDRTTSGPSTASYDGTNWSFPKSLDIKNWYNNDDQVNYNLNKAQNVLLISANRNDSKGGRDLYVSRLENGSWTEPLNLGEINSTGNEVTPFLDDDNRTLYFSTDGQGGEGSYDVFVTSRKGDSWTSWESPVNLGNKVNSSTSEMYFVISPTKDNVFFSRGETSGNADIYSLNLIEEKEEIIEVAEAPKSTSTTVEGKVTDRKTGEPLKAVISYTKKDGNQNRVATDDNGNYKMQLSNGASYNFTPRSSGHITDNFSLTIPEESPEKIEKNMDLAPIEHIVIALEHVYFDIGKSTIREESYEELNDAYAQLSKYEGEVSITVEGHTDNTGNADFNRKLSGDRAKAVADYLIEKGLDSEKVASVGYGPDKPVADNSTSEGRQKNRRVELVID